MTERELHPRSVPDVDPPAPQEIPDEAPTVAADGGAVLAESRGAAPATWIGRVIDDRYRVVELLGEGGMGAVYVAEHLKLHKSVALKVIRAQFAGDGDLAARFAREAMAAAQFEHPHVASATDYGTLPEGGAYLVLQLVQGRSLTEILRQRVRLGWAEACEVGAQIADALSAAAAAGIVHRDLKPDNVLIERRDDGTDLVKILDFGIAHVPLTTRQAPEGAKASEKLTRAGAIVGTPGYMSPEQAVGDPVDPRADLYALGVVLWESVTGRRLWEAASLTDLVKKQLSETPPSLRSVTGDATIPDELEVLITQLLQRSSQDRPERAGFVRDRLRQLALPMLSERYSAMGSGDTLPGRASPTRPFGGAAWKVGAALGVVMLVVALTITMQRRQPTVVDGASVGEAEGVEAAEGIPSELAADVETLVGSDRRKDRDLAAQRIVDAVNQQGVTLPAYVVRIAALHAARGCPAKKAALAKLIELGDTRIVPTLAQLARAPRLGCGDTGEQDCLSCLREDLERELARRGALPAAP